MTREELEQLRLQTREAANVTHEAVRRVAFGLHETSAGEFGRPDGYVMLWGGDVTRCLGVRVDTGGMWEIVQNDGEGSQHAVCGDSVDTLIGALQAAKAVAALVQRELR